MIHLGPDDNRRHALQAIQAIALMQAMGCQCLTTPPTEIHELKRRTSPRDRKLRGIDIQKELELIREKRSNLPANMRKLIVAKYGKPKSSTGT